MIRTSLSHPLRIDSVDCAAGRIGMTLCPGKKGSSTFGGFWMRDLKADLKVIAAWDADLVITLMQPAEMAESKVAGLGAAVAAMGLQWLHLPITDLGAPNSAWEQRWRDAGPGVRALLRRGGRVLIHCRGGLGRTGVVAAKLLTECGVRPEEARRRVKMARPGAIETAVQEAYVLGLAD